MTESAKASVPDSPALAAAALNPFAALARVANAIEAVDRFLTSPTRGFLENAVHRRLAYLRNTLAVSYELWQYDVHSRVSRSRHDIYVFCMTDREKLAFERRMIPALQFAAEELRDLALKPVAPVMDLVDNAVLDAEDYVANNKAQIRAGIEGDEGPKWRVYNPLRLPEIKT